MQEKGGFAEPATEEQIQRVGKALEAENIEVIVVDRGKEAAQKIFELVPEGAEVGSSKSKTLEDIGVYSQLHESGRFDSVRARYMAMDRTTQMREIRKTMAAPDYMLGSVHALTEDGELITASYSGSQIGPYAASAGRVILVVGSQKIVRDLDEGLRRMREYATPYEDERLRQQLGVGTKAAKILIHSAEGRPGRTTVILVWEPVGV
jgi:acyl-CoA hydrolase